MTTMPAGSAHHAPTEAAWLAAGSFAITVGGFLAIFRLSDSSVLLQLLLSVLFLAPVAYAALFAGGDSRADAVIYFSTVLLSFLVLATLFDALTSGSDLGDGAVTLLLLATAVKAAYLGVKKNSGVSTLLAGLFGSAAIFSAINWLFDPSKVTGYRWIAFMLVGLLGWYGRDLFTRKPNHGVALVETAGVLLFVLTVLVGVETVGAGVGAILGGVGGDRFASEAPSGLWNLVILGGAAGLVAFGVHARTAGPPLVALFSVIGFLVLESSEGNLLWWPILLVAAGAAVMARALLDSSAPSAPVPAPAAPETTVPPPLP